MVSYQSAMFLAKSKVPVLKESRGMEGFGQIVLLCLQTDLECSVFCFVQPLMCLSEAV